MGMVNAASYSFLIFWWSVDRRLSSMTEYQTASMLQDPKTGNFLNPTPVVLGMSTRETMAVGMAVLMK